MFPISTRSRTRERVAWGFALLGAALVAGIAVWNVMRSRPLPLRPTTRFTLTPPEADAFHADGIAFSPHGSDLVYVGSRDGVHQLYRRSMGELDWSPISGTEGAMYPFFLPDGKWLGFFAGGELKKVSLAGGPAVTLCPTPGDRRGGSWGRDDVILFGSTESPGLMQVSASGGAAEVVTGLEADEEWHGSPDILPGGKAVLFTVWSGDLATGWKSRERPCRSSRVLKSTWDPASRASPASHSRATDRSSM